MLENNIYIFSHSLADGRLPLEQVPLLEINGKQMIQTNAITRHIARISDLDGVNEDERTMYV